MTHAVLSKGFSQKFILKVKTNGTMGKKVIRKGMAFYCHYFWFFYVNLENEK